MNTWIILILAVIFSAFFSGMEIAFISSNRLRIELDRKKGFFGSHIIKIFTDNPGQFIATMLIGNNISLVVYGIIISRMLSPLLSSLFASEPLILISNTIISTAIIFFLAEFIPKILFRISPNFFLKLFSIPTYFFFMIFYPISRFIIFISNAILGILPGGKQSWKTKNEENIVFSKADLDHFVQFMANEEIKDESEKENIRIFQNALYFSNLKVRECMVPRTEIEAVEINTDIQKLKQKFIETRYSRIIVYSGSIDQVTGYVELKDIFRLPRDIKTILRKLIIVPETMPANRLLKQFVDEKINIALVVDEFGGTSGMVTLEDVLEEIVGEIEDEHDEYELIEKQTAPGEFIFSGRLEIDYLNEKYNLNIPEDGDYETLAGFILYHHGSIPRNNDVIKIRNFSIKILKATSTRVDLINLKIE